MASAAELKWNQLLAGGCTPKRVNQIHTGCSAVPLTMRVTDCRTTPLKLWRSSAAILRSTQA